MPARSDPDAEDQGTRGPHPRSDHPSPKHPSSDRMPPYSPGGVPPAGTDEKANPEDRTKSAWPPKRKP